MLCRPLVRFYRRLTCCKPGRFATRALAQSLAREFGPQNIHVAHAIIDGIIDTPTTRQWMPDLFKEEGTYLDPIDIADAYVALHKQNPSCWSQEVRLDHRQAVRMMTDRALSRSTDRPATSQGKVVMPMVSRIMSISRKYNNRGHDYVRAVTERMID